MKKQEIKNKKIDFHKIEKKWQEKWEKKKAFEVKEDKKKKKYYVLEMFPYPSGSGLHMGHTFNYVIGDIYARYMRMKGFNVLYPMGYDSFGLPAENAAIKAGENPKKYTEKSIKNFIKQQKELGLSYDWSRIVMSHTPEYYKWDQWIFLKMFEKGLAYKKKASVNWCSKCNSVLANEQVHNGKCWRHEDTDVEIKYLEQWFFKITDYAEELYDSIDSLTEWPEDVKAMQKNWIGKSYGAEINFKINGENWPIFTTRADTIYGVSFMVISAQHPRLMELVTKEQKKEVETFLKKIKSTSEKDANELEKEGEFTGSYAINPMNEEKVPVYTGNFVVADYGSGMVMAVPAHDKRDFEFAKKYGLPIRQVIRKLKAPIRSYVMGSENISEKDFTSINIKIVEKTSDGDYKIEIPKESIKKYEELIAKKMSPGFWNEYIAEEVVFLFKHKDGKIERLVMNDKNLERIDKLACEFIENSDDVEVFDKLRTSVRGTLRASKSPEQDTQGLFDEKTISSEFSKGQFLKTSDTINRIVHNNQKYDPKSTDNYINGAIANNSWYQPLIVHEEEGILINSSEFTDLTSEEAKKQITKKLEGIGLGKEKIQYKLRDWLISRQRYWGTPIPIIYCEKCGAVPVPEKNLPVVLPDKVKFGEGNPLAGNKEFVNVKCPKCEGKATRETDTMDTFVNSSWYFLRYCDPKNKNKIFDKEKAAYWMPIDTYIGGKEHACMHLIYFRFYTKFLRDLGLINVGEPDKVLFNQGMLHGEDGAVMSKSRGNVVLPETVSKKYGIDTARLFLMSIASPDKDILWSDKGVEGSSKFLKKVVEYIENFEKPSQNFQNSLRRTLKEGKNIDYSKSSIRNFKKGKSSAKLEHKINKAVKGIDEDIKKFRYNLAVIKLRMLFESFDSEISKEDLEKFVKMLSLFCPHVAEEFWEMLGNKGFVSLSSWSEVDESKIKEEFDKADRIIESTIGDIINILKLLKEKQNKEGNKIYLYVLPQEINFYDGEEIAKRVGKEVKIFVVNDKNKYDPQGKAAKAKPGKPAIYIE
ncbi:MAG: leucine--tRNA ligase [Nanoarchaeota archaeon]|nr:leucine--tRNA ligase [Nanoarchaeota archaeon]